MPTILSFAQGLLDLAAAEARRRPELARKALRTAAGLPPHATAAWRGLAELNEREGNLAAAREAWREVLARAPEDGSAHSELARLLAAEGRFEEALGHDARAATAGSNPDPAAHGLRLLRVGRTDEALAGLRAALAAEPNNTAVRAALTAATQAEQEPRTLRFPTGEAAARPTNAAPPPGAVGGRTGGEGASGGQQRNTPRPRSAAPAAGLPKLAANVTLAACLKGWGEARISALRERLGLLPKESPAAARAELAAVLQDEGTLRPLLAGLPAPARRLLKSLVKLGGFAPAAALFQTAGPEAPPPDFAQPLLDLGVLHLGADARGENLVAAIPATLLAPVSAALAKAKSRGR